MNFLHNSYSDYLFYLFYRISPEEYGLDSLLDLSDVKTLNDIISLQEIVASANIKTYEETFKYAELYRGSHGRVIKEPYPKILAYSDSVPNYDSIIDVLEKGKKYYSSFEKI